MTINPIFLDKLSRRPYRQAFLRETVTSWIVYQLRGLREQRGWSQAQLAAEAGTSQPAIARNESSDYRKWTVATLLDLADAFDVAFEVRFVDWATFIKRAEGLRESLSVPAFSRDQFSAAEPSYRPAVVIVASGQGRSYAESNMWSRNTIGRLKKFRDNQIDRQLLEYRQDANPSVPESSEFKSSRLTMLEQTPGEQGSSYQCR